MQIQKKTKWMFFCIILVSIAGMLWFGARKEGYHVDEMYSYGLANSEYLPFMHFGESGYDVKDWMMEYGAGESFADLFRNLWNDFQILKEYNFNFYDTPIYRDYQVAQANSADTLTTTWVSGRDYRDYITVSEDNTFNYASVYYNQRGDVHPPLYYMVLHTICSVFQGTFSKWYAMSINVVALILTMLLLFRMIRKYVGDERLALATVAIYGLSCGFFTTGLYLRMYAMMTLFVVAYCYMHLKLLDAEYALQKRDVFRLALVTLLGYMTHYYFVLYALAMAVVCTIWMCVGKRWRQMVRYLLTLMVSAVIGICIWPFSVKHVFSGYRGRAAWNTLATGEFYGIKTKLLFQQLCNQLFDGYWFVPVICLLILVIGIICYRKEIHVLEKGTLLIIPVLFYVVCTAQIVPFYADRYVMCTYPFWCLFAVSAIWMLSALVVRIKPLRRVKAEVVAVVLCVGFIVLNCGFWNKPAYLFEGGQECSTILENTHCVYVLPDGDWNESAEDSLLLSKCEAVAVVYYSNLAVLKDTYDYEDGDCVMVVINRNMNKDTVLQKVIQTLGIEQMQVVLEEESTNFVRVYMK